MIERAAGQHPAKPVAQPAQVKQEAAQAKPAETSQELVAVSRDTSNFVGGRGRSLLGAGNPPGYSKRPPVDSKRVSQLASNSGLIVPNKKARSR